MQSDPQSPCDRFYGCLHVRTGDEDRTARTIESLFPDVEAHAVAQTKHRSVRGVRSYSIDIMMPGYVLIRACGDVPVSRLLAVTSVRRVLRYDDSDWRLRNADRDFAAWMFDHQGNAGVSHVYMEGDGIRIIDGPLKTLQGDILRIDKRNRNALVTLGLARRMFQVWLAFEWMEPRSE